MTVVAHRSTTLESCRLRRLILVATVAQAYGRSGSSLRRPLVTGCLQACGVADQACVALCQVCVERHHCRRVASDCEACAQTIRTDKRKVGAASHGHLSEDSDLVLDSGGIPLLRDGVRTLLVRAQGDELYARRHLRSARAEVLQAQRQSEWAASQRRDEGKDLHEARHALHAARKDLAEWRLKTARKLKAANKTLYNGPKLEAEGKESTKQIEKDARWIEGGLQEEIEKEHQDVRDAIADHRMAWSAENLSQRALKETKRLFLHTASIYHGSERHVRRLARKVRQLSLRLNAPSPGSSRESARAGEDSANTTLAPSRSRASIRMNLPAVLLPAFALVTFGVP